MSFAAKYRGTCDSCWEDIEPGERVRYTKGDDLVHDGCTDEGVDGPSRRPSVEVCQSCWMQRPCPCDDGQGEA